MKKQIIDFVITWVDGSDPLWFRQKQNAKKKQGVSVDIDDRIERYRDWEILKYLFRSIENFAPWVNNVYFVTCGHLRRGSIQNVQNCRLFHTKILFPKNISPPLTRIPLSGISTG